MLGIINMMTSYFQALGKAVKSLTITLLRNAVLFIPGVMILNHFWKLDGVIAAQPVVETALAVICTVMYATEVKSRRSSGHCLPYHEKASGNPVVPGLPEREKRS